MDVKLYVVIMVASQIADSQFAESQNASPISRFPNCRHMKNIVIASRIMLLIYEGNCK